MTNADGSILIDVDMNTSNAEKEIKRLQNRVTKLGETREINIRLKSDVDKQLSELGARLDREKAKLFDLQNSRAAKDDIAEQQIRVRGLQSDFDKLVTQSDRYAARIQQADTEMGILRNTAGQLIRQTNENTKAENEHAKSVRRTTAEAKKGEGAFSKFGHRILGLAKRVFVFSLITSALRGVRSWLGNVINSNDEASEALARLKGALLTLVQPLVSVVIPAFTTLVNVLTSVVNAVASLVATLFGTTYDEASTAAEALYDESNALDDVGSSAGGAEKQLASFDKINKLSGSGGGGKSSKSKKPVFGDMKDLELPSWLKDLMNGLTLSIKDVLFDWDDLNPEQIAEKAVSGLLTAMGGIAGFLLTGSLSGGITGAIYGLAISMLVNALTFDHDGVLERSEIQSMLIDALGGLVGGLIGFKVGGIGGAFMGATIGVAVTALVQKLLFKKGDGTIDDLDGTYGLAGVLGGLSGAIIGFNAGGLVGGLIGATAGCLISLIASKLIFDPESARHEAWLDSEEGQKMQQLIDESVAAMQFAADLNVRIEQITGEITPETQADLATAKHLIDEIFTLSEADNQTAAQAALIQEKINELNALNLDGLNGVFQTTKDGYIIPTREEVETLMNKILAEYQLEAMREAYIQLYKDQYTAETNLTTATDDLKQKMDDLYKAEADVTLAEIALEKANVDHKTALAALFKKVQDGEIAYAQYNTEAGKLHAQLIAVETKLANAKDKLEAQKTATINAKTTVELYQSAIGTCSTKITTLETDISALTTALSTGNAAALDDGKNVMAGYAQGITDNTETAKTAMEDATNTVLEAERALNGINSPSTTYASDGMNMMIGLANGITDNAYRPKEALKTVLNDMITMAQRAINNIIYSFNSASSSMDFDGTSGFTRVPTVSIPRLAQGAVIPPNREFAAILGDQKSGTNIETPLATMVQAFKMALNDGNGRNEAYMVLDNEVFGKLVYKLGNRESKRVGVDLTGGRA